MMPRPFTLKSCIAVAMPVWFCLVLAGGIAFAQTDAKPTTPKPTPAPKTDKETADADNERAVERKKIAEKHRAEIDELKSKSSELENQRAKLKKEPDSVPADLRPEYPVDADLVQLKQLEKDATAAARLAEAKLKKLIDEKERRKLHRDTVVERTQKLEATRKEKQEALVKPAPKGEALVVTNAERKLWEAERDAAEAEIEKLGLETDYFNDAETLLTKQIEAAKDDRNQQKRLVRAWGDVITDRRGWEADQQSRAARTQVEKLEFDKAPLVLQSMARENLEWAERRTGTEETIGLVAKIKSVHDGSAETEESHNTLAERRESVEEKLQKKLENPEISGLIGHLLLAEKRRLPNVRQHKSNIKEYRQQQAQTQFDQIGIRDELKKLRNLKEQKQKLIKSLQSEGMTDAEKTRIRDNVDLVLDFRKKTLIALDADCTTYIEVLFKLVVKEEDLITATEEFDQLIKKHILWLRNTDPLNAEQLDLAKEAIRWLCDGDKWSATGDLLLDSIIAQPTFFTVSLLLLVLVTWKRIPFRRQLRELGAAAEKSYTEPFRTTLIAWLLTVGIAIDTPLIFWLVGQLLATGPESSEFAYVVGRGLIDTAYFYFTLELIRVMCHSNGLAESHFRWNERRLIPIRRGLRWLATVGLPCIFLIDVFDRQSDDRFNASMGRIALMVWLGVVALFIAKTCRPVSATAATSGSATRAAGVAKIPVWLRIAYPAGIFGPVILLLLAGFGFHYTAVQLSGKLVATGWLILSLVVAYAMVVRWLYLARSRLALEQLTRRKKEELRAAEVADDDEETAPARAATPTVSATDLAAVNEQTRRLSRSVAAFLFLSISWLIWQDALPALDMLDVKMWDSATMKQGVLVVKTITIASLFIAVGVVAIAFYAAKNLPGLLEILLLKRLPVDPGARYAIATLVRYGLNILGIVIASNVLGIVWSSVQWLVAAMTFGLAFGMQEIFANFVSGIILILERPIRIGDVVTVGDVTGKVSVIRIRATTIVDWDRKEFIVPNKELITGRLLNWTLSNETNRVVFNIGIAYGSDTAHAEEILRDILADHPHILTEPGPMITFEAFGDSTLNFVVRAFLAKMKFRLTTTHEINTQIHQRFAKAGIEIAFPQQDIHVRTLPESWPTPINKP